MVGTRTDVTKHATTRPSVHAPHTHRATPKRPSTLRDTFSDSWVRLSQTLAKSPHTQPTGSHATLETPRRTPLPSVHGHLSLDHTLAETPPHVWEGLSHADDSPATRHPRSPRPSDLMALLLSDSVTAASSAPGTHRHVSRAQRALRSTPFTATAPPSLALIPADRWLSRFDPSSLVQPTRVRLLPRPFPLADSLDRACATRRWPRDQSGGRRHSRLGVARAGRPSHPQPNVSCEALFGRASPAPRRDAGRVHGASIHVAVCGIGSSEASP